MLLPNKVYDALKWIAIIFMPAAIVLWTELGNVWGWPYVTEIAATLAAIEAFMGATLGVSTATYNKQRNDKGGQQ